MIFLRQIFHPLRITFAADGSRLLGGDGGCTGTARLKPCFTEKPSRVSVEEKPCAGGLMRAAALVKGVWVASRSSFLSHAHARFLPFLKRILKRTLWEVQKCARFIEFICVPPQTLTNNLPSVCWW